MEAYFYTGRNNEEFIRAIKQSINDSEHYDLIRAITTNCTAIGDVTNVVSAESKMYGEIILAINLILLDNIYRHITKETMSGILSLVNNNAFQWSIHIRQCYLDGIVETYQSSGVMVYNSGEMGKLIFSYIDLLWRNNSVRLNEAVINMLYYLHENNNVPREVTNYTFSVFGAAPVILVPGGNNSSDINSRLTIGDNNSAIT